MITALGTSLIKLMYIYMITALGTSLIKLMYIYMITALGTSLIKTKSPTFPEHEVIYYLLFLFFKTVPRTSQ